jgi:ABC-type polysaccharide/polyol phosphate transport system ATPase subunit
VTPIISVEGVSKCYRVYARPQDRLREALSWRRRVHHHEFWALRDVSFQLARGEALGIVGRNGAGKSTLLQILAGTLAPTTGRVVMGGRASALLELGSGFSPEYTGRDNVFLYGSILGFTRAQITDRFDEIAAFADIGEHLDQPMKTYSSGMIVRLAFAVITLLEPEILIADEWLAVGDVLFQSRCLKRMKRLLAGGMTLVFVSHDATAVQLMTQRCLWLHDGRARGLGASVDVAQDYLHAQLGAEEPPEPTVGDEIRFSTTGELFITNARFVDEHGEERTTFQTGETLRMILDYEARTPVDEPVFAVSVFNENGVYCLSAQSPPGVGASRLEGIGAVELEIPALPLNHGEYRVSVAALDSRCVFFFDHHRPRYLLSVRTDHPTWGIVSVPQRWTLRARAAAVQRFA